jgi:hypothetical protein
MDHGHYEEKSMWQPLLMQLGCNLLTKPDWINIISHIHDKVEDSNGKASQATCFMVCFLIPSSIIDRAWLITLLGSHKCGNGGGTTVTSCANPFCMIWESTVNNNGRKPCHSKFKELKELREAGHDVSEAACFCVPGISHPCSNRRHYQTAEGNIKHSFKERFASMIGERRNDNGERVNQLGRCPDPDCNIELIQVLSLKDYFAVANLKKIVTNMNLAHNARMALR